MRKNIARKLAVFLAFVVLLTTFGSDYNSIGVRASSDEPETIEQVEPNEETVEDSLWEPMDSEQEPAVEETVEEPVNDEPEVQEEEAPPVEEPQVEEPVQEDIIPEEQPTEDAQVTDIPEEEIPAADAPAEETPAEAPAEEAPAEEAPAEEAPADAAPEEPAAVTPEGIVISYVAGEGGTVSIDTETVVEAATGSTAKADEGYKFVNWTDAAGTEVGTDATFIPADGLLVNGAVFTANFKKEEVKEAPKMPAQSFKGSAGGIDVVVDAPEGAFPEKTDITVTEVKDEEILDAVKEAADGSQDAAAVAVNISFSKDGIEIEPEVPISVKLTSQIIATDNDTQIVHVNDKGEAEVIDSVIKEDVAEFTSADFSIYAISYNPDDIVTPRRTYKFQDSDGTAYMFTNEAGEEVDNQIIKDGESLAEVDAPYHSDQEFLGWYEYAGDAYTDNKIKFGEPIDLSALTEDEEVIVRAKFINHYVVTYLSEPKGDSRERAVIETQEVISDDGSYTVNMSYEPADPETSAFLGWKLENPAQQNSIVVDGDIPDYYANGTTIKIKDNITFVPYTPKGHWLIFHENGKGATYTPSQFVEGGVLTEANRDHYIPADPTRNGYKFDGWYTCEVDSNHKPIVDENGDPIGEKYTFLGELPANINLCAKWTAAEKAPYTVIIWKEKLEGGYDYAESVTVENATVGQPVTGIVLNKTECFATIDGKKYGGPTSVKNPTDGDMRYVGFVPDHYDNAKKVSAEGNTIINVYFNRITYQFQFRIGYYNGRQLRGYLYGNRQQSTDLSYRNGDVNGKTLTDDGNNVYFTTTVKYGAAIEWPEYEIFTALEERNSRKLVSWILDPNCLAYTNLSNQGGETVKGKITILDEQILGNWKSTTANFVDARYDASHNDYSYYICFEDAEQPTSAGPDTPAEGYVQDQKVVYKGKTYTVYEIVPSRSGSNFSGQKAPGYVGYDPIKIDENTYDYKELYSDPKPGSGNRYVRGMAFFYTRNTSCISFMDGAYYTGKNAPVEGMEPGTVLNEVEDIKFGVDLTSYNKGGADYYVPDPLYDGVVFAGWYKDDKCTDPYTFDTMTKETIVVYAKWMLKEYRVFLHPNPYEADGVTVKTNYGIGNQATSFRVDYGDMITPTAPNADDYEFMGWYRDPEFSELFSYDATELNDSTVFTAYDQTDPTETDQYGEAKTDQTNKDKLENRFWIERKLDLYARWSSKLIGANGINVEYDVDNDTTLVKDEKIYSDNSAAVAKDCPTEKAEIEKDDETLTFDHWVVQKWNGTAYEDSDTTVREGKSFSVFKSYAQVTENPGSTPESPSYKYTVRLKAVYKNKKNDDIKLTHINYHGNGGTTTLVSDESKNLTVSDDKTTASYTKIQLNDGIVLSDEGFVYPGYKFLGWSAYEAKDTVDYKVGDKVGVDQKTPVPNDLYAVWEELPVSYTVKYYKDSVDDEANLLASIEYKGDDAVAAGTPIELAEGTEKGQLNWQKENAGTGYEDGEQQGDVPYYIQPNEYDADGNLTNPQVIKVLYVKSVVDIVVKYYKDDESVDANLLGSTTLKDVEVGDTVKIAEGTAEGQLDWKKTAAGEGYASGEQQGTVPYTVTADEGQVIIVLYKPDPNQTYTVTFEAEKDENGELKGDVDPKSDSDQILSNENINGSTATPADGYKFEGWYKVTGEGESEVETKIEGAEAALSDTLTRENLNKDGNVYQDTLYRAKFEPSDEEYTVTYEAELDEEGNPKGEVDPKSQSDQVLSDEKITGSKAEPAAGYEFEGWYKVTGEGESEVETKIEGAEATLSGDLAKANLEKSGKLFADTVYVAKFVPNDQQYTVTYEAELDEDGDPKGEVNPKSQSDQVLSNEKITGSKAEPATGYEFEGWYKVVKTETGETETRIVDSFEVLTETQARDNLEMDGDIYADTIYRAKFVPDGTEYEVTYVAELDEKGNPKGEVDPTSETDQILSNEKITGSVATPAAGYEFEGWYKLVEVEGEEDQYVKIEDAGASLTATEARANLNKKDKIFENTTYLAKFIPDDKNKYTVTYDAEKDENGVEKGTVDPKSQEEQVLKTDAITGSEAEAAFGYIFDAWYKVDDDTGAETEITGSAANLSEGLARDNLNRDAEDKIYADTHYRAHFKDDPEAQYEVTYEAELDEKGNPKGEVDVKSETAQVHNTEGINGSTATANNGYVFEGWYKVTKNGATEVETRIEGAVEKLEGNLLLDNLNKDGVNYQDTLFRAKFIPDETAKYYVQYMAENDEAGVPKGTVNPTEQEEQVLVDTAITGSEAKPSKGYKFDSWYKVEMDDGVITNETKIEGSELVLSEDLAKANLNKVDGLFADTFYLVKFVPSDEMYTVTYEAQAGADGKVLGTTDPTEQTEQILINDAITGSTATPAAGVEFAGWYKGDELICEDPVLPEGIAKEYLNFDIIGADGEVIEQNSEVSGGDAGQDINPIQEELTRIVYKDTTYTAKFKVIDYNVTFEYRLADGVEPPANWTELVEALKAYNRKANVGDKIVCPDLPIVEGYTFSPWSKEDVVKQESLGAKILNVLGGILGFLTGKTKAHAESQVYDMPANDIVIYSIVTKSEPQVDPQPSPTPTPRPDDDDDDDDDDDPKNDPVYYDDNHNDPQVLGDNRKPEDKSVLGAKREEEKKVLGARRGGTEDTTNTSRVIVLLIAAGAVATLLATGKRRKEAGDDK